MDVGMRRQLPLKMQNPAVHSLERLLDRYYFPSNVAMAWWKPG
jgi:hypothetical protein